MTPFETKNFGQISYSHDAVIEFPGGLPGFENQHRFLLVRFAHTDPLGTTSPRIKVQVKRQPGTKMSVDAIRSFMAVLGDQDVGIFISAGGFTSHAEREAFTFVMDKGTLLYAPQVADITNEVVRRYNDRFGAGSAGGKAPAKTAQPAGKQVERDLHAVAIGKC